MSAIVAHEQNPATGLLYSLLIDGLDVMGQVPFDSLHVTEAGPGAVSSLAFTTLDPTKLVTILDNAYIQMWDYTRDLPVFSGWVQTQSPTPAYGGAGRDIDVTCYGIEAILDQIIVPSLTGMFGTAIVSPLAVLQAIAQVAPLRALGVEPGIAASSQATPLGGGFSASGGFGMIPGFDVTGTVSDGVSIRAAWDAYFTAFVKTVAYLGVPSFTDTRLTVDFWRGLRLFGVADSINAYQSRKPSDYATLTVVETSSGSPAATSIRYTRDTSPGSVITAVYVKGGNAAGTGWVVGDTTKGRAEAYVAYSTSLTSTARDSIGAELLGRKGTGAGRGTLTIENFTPINAHPGSPLIVTNAGLGWTAKAFIVSQIDKTFQKSGKQDWTVTFFDAADAPTAGAPSFARRLRSITRSLS